MGPKDAARVTTGARESSVIAVLGLVSVVAGGVVACLAERFPAQIEALETGAGVLLLGGFALWGSALPILV